MKTKKTVVIILMISVLIFSGIFKIYGAINSEYGGDTGSIDITDDTIKDNVVLDYIGSFIFAIGNIFQDITSWIMGVATGESKFPWADLVVFNTIAMLDVNFFNPDTNSLLSMQNSIGMGEIIRNIYFTALSIGIGFLGIIVGVMAIRMAITTIASEKAKYKESIITWLTSIVLLFGLHYMLSFLFYLNEELVVTASKILNSTMAGAGKEIGEVINQDLNEDRKVVVDNFINKIGESEIGSEAANILRENSTITATLLNDAAFRDNLNMISGNDTNDFFKGGGFMGIGNKLAIGLDNGLNAYADFRGIDYTTQAGGEGKFVAKCVEIITRAMRTNSAQSTEELLNIFMESYEGMSKEDLIWQVENNLIGEFIEENNLSDEEFNAINAGHENDTSNAHWLEYMRQNGVNIPDYSTYTNEQLMEEIREYETQAVENVKINNIETYQKTYDNCVASYGADNVVTLVYKYALQAVKGELTLAGDSENIIANLGEFFKQTAWSIDEDEGGWAPTKANVIAAILYTLFVFESIGFFISYIKRLFIVVVLAVLGPFVVIYDFFVKSAMGAQKSIFGVWLKEICTLIFVQTFHAFLLAIILSIIVKIIAGSYASTLDGGIEAVGLLCIFALLALPRLELLVKNIFGLTSGVADPSLRGGLKSSLTGSLFALRGAKKLLDNPRKIIGGAGRFLSSSVALRVAKNNRAKQRINDNSNDQIGDENGDNKRTIRGPRGTISPSLGKGNSSELTSAIKALTTELKKQNMHADDKDNKNKMKELNDAIEKAKQDRTEALKSIGTGLLETAGAAHGAVAGAVIAAGTDNNVLEYTLTGAGIGDTLGKTVAGVSSASIGLAKDIKTGIKAELEAHTGATGKAYKQVEKELREEMKRNDEELNKKIYEYSKNRVNVKNTTPKAKPKLPNKKNINVDAGNIS